MDYRKIPVWELLQKRITWDQIGAIKGKKILDFGSGQGITASYFAEDNDVVAVEPDINMISNEISDYNYVQIHGGFEELKKFKNESFDVILCHNVFEYAKEREDIAKEFARILKHGGLFSLLKHNRAGRVMQMVVLLNNFEHANELLDGKDGHTMNFDDIHYYNDEDILKWCDEFTIDKIYGSRVFWDLQQNQKIQKDKKWQEQMLSIEKRVSELNEFKDAAFFHHLLLHKK